MTLNFRRKINEKHTASRAFQQLSTTPNKTPQNCYCLCRRTILLGRISKSDRKWGDIVSYVSHQYSRAVLDLSVEVNLSLYYGGVMWYMCILNAHHILLVLYRLRYVQNLLEMLCFFTIMTVNSLTCLREYSYTHT